MEGDLPEEAFKRDAEWAFDCDNSRVSGFGEPDLDLLEDLEREE